MIFRARAVESEQFIVIYTAEYLVTDFENATSGYFYFAEKSNTFEYVQLDRCNNLVIFPFYSVYFLWLYFYSSNCNVI